MQTDKIIQLLHDRIKLAANNADMAETSRLSRMALRIQAIGDQIRTLEEEVRQIGESLSMESKPASPVEQKVACQVSGNSTELTAAVQDAGELVIEINWGACNRNRPNARISRGKASDTLVAFLNELGTTLGAEALQKLTLFKVSRGPLVSQDPQSDYVNKTSGSLYVHHRIGNTQYFALTHSSTAEKVAAAKEAWRFLGLTPGALSISKAKRLDAYDYM
jgi:hypothetical protein